MLKRILRRDRDGWFLIQGFDGPDVWTQDPLNATNLTLYEDEAEVKGSLYNKPGYTLVEFRLSATPTGLTCRDFYKDGVFVERKTSSKKLFVTLDDITSHGPIAQVELDVALWDETRYAGEIRFKVLRTAEPTIMRISAGKDDAGQVVAISGWRWLIPTGSFPVQGDTVTMPNGFGTSN